MGRGPGGFRFRDSSGHDASGTGVAWGMVSLAIWALALSQPPAIQVVAESGEVLLAPEVQAVMSAEPLGPGESTSFQVSLTLPESVSASGAGIPAPILQLEVPASVQLLGEYKRSYRDLARNEFLAEPFERLMKSPELTIPFEVIGEPAEGASIGISVVGYLTATEEAPARFFRRRLELAIASGAEATAGDDRDSTWGEDAATLDIGDTVSPLVLPIADGGEVDLSQYLGKQKVILTTYRAFW